MIGSSGAFATIGYLAGTVSIRGFGVSAIGTVLGLACVGLCYSSLIYRRQSTGTVDG
jgi:amino acid transporter